MQAHSEGEDPKVPWRVTGGMSSSSKAEESEFDNRKMTAATSAPAQEEPSFVFWFSF